MKSCSGNLLLLLIVNLMVAGHLTAQERSEILGRLPVELPAANYEVPESARSFAAPVDGGISCGRSAAASEQSALQKCDPVELSNRAFFLLNKNKYIRFKRKAGGFVSGKLSRVDDQGFELDCGPLKAPRSFSYSQLASSPELINPGLKRVLLGLQYTALVAASIVLLPVFLPLAFLGILPAC